MLDDDYRCNIISIEINSFLDQPMGYYVELVDINTGQKRSVSFKKDGTGFEVLSSEKYPRAFSIQGEFIDFAKEKRSSSSVKLLPR